jgi:hypothetical protein
MTKLLRSAVLMAVVLIATISMSSRSYAGNGSGTLRSLPLSADLYKPADLRQLP